MFKYRAKYIYLFINKTNNIRKSFFTKAMNFKNVKRYVNI